MSYKKVYHTYEDVRAFVESIGYKIISTEYFGMNKPLIVSCDKNHLYKTIFYRLKRGDRCGTCSGHFGFDIESVTAAFTECGYTLLSKRYVNSKSKLTVQCQDGHVYETTFSNFNSKRRCKECYHESQKGEGNWSWAGGITPELMRLRNGSAYTTWRNAVFDRDKFTCQCCFQVGRELNAHHILNFSDNELLRFDVDNGITLCKSCHSGFHRKYGKRHNSQKQLDEWLTMREQKVVTEVAK